MRGRNRACLKHLELQLSHDATPKSARVSEPPFPVEPNQETQTFGFPGRTLRMLIFHGSWNSSAGEANRSTLERLGASETLQVFRNGMPRDV